MVNELIECFIWGVLVPLPFFFVLYLVRACKKYFQDASNIGSMD